MNRAKLQAFGGFLTAMVIPNMGAFIAWGFITALFIPTGWIPNEGFNELVAPMVKYMLPMMLIPGENWYTANVGRLLDV